MYVRALSTSLSLFLVVFLVASPAFGCFAVVVGRLASEDGSVLVGHAEQDRGQVILSFRRVHRQLFPEGALVRLERGGSLPQVRRTAGFLWSELLGFDYSDSFLNDFGVSVVSDFCPSREDGHKTLARRGEIRDGGIGYMLRRLIAERAHTARDGVALAGQLIERFGYLDSGRTYVIADPREAWLLAVARGRRWVARRVPDDQVVLLPNVYVIDEVHLENRRDFLGSPDLVDYAAKRGWFNPDGPGGFRFDVAYGAHGGAPDERRWKGHQLVTGRPILWPPPTLPFGVRPARKMTVLSVLEVLRGVIPANRTTGSPTQEGAVFQLRAGLPREIGCVYWRTSGEPSMNVLLPWYLGIDWTQQSYHQAVDLSTQLSLAHHYMRSSVRFEREAPLAWQTFVSLQSRVRGDPQGALASARSVWSSLERRAFSRQRSIDERAAELFAIRPSLARAYLSRCCAELADEAMREVRRLLGV